MRPVQSEFVNCLFVFVHACVCACLFILLVVVGCWLLGWLIVLCVCGLGG